ACASQPEAARYRASLLEAARYRACASLTAARVQRRPLCCMLRRMLHLTPSQRSSLPVALAILAMLLGSPCLFAQWIKHPTAAVRRKADGTVNMSAPAPRMADGKPDFSGIWTTAEPNNRRSVVLSSPKDQVGPRDAQSSSEAQSPGNPSAITGSRQMANIGVDLPGGLPYQPWLVPI